MERTERQKELHRISNARYRESHKAEISARAKEYRKTHPDKKRTSFENHKYDLKKYYGISWEDKVRMFEKQNGLCGLCALPLRGLTGKDTHIDHIPGTK